MFRLAEWPAAKLVLALCLGVSPAASGATLEVIGVGLGEYSVPMLTDSGQGLTPSNAFAGQIQIEINDSPYVAYCIDLYTSISLQTYNSVFGTPLDFQNGVRAAWLMENYAASVATAAEAAALQLALWDIVHDAGDGFSTGTIQLDLDPSSALAMAANGLVAVSAGQSSVNGTILYNVSIAGSPAQTLIVAGVLTETPEPGTWAMVLLGGGATIALRRRRQKSAS